MGVAVVVLVAAALGVDTLRTRGELRVPPLGEVAAASVAGHPVFIVHADDDTVQVLDAVSPHASPGLKVLAWCETAQAFEDLWHGSIFSPDGSWLGGPAPTGMARYRITVRGDRVEVGEREPTPAREDRPADLRPPGPRCDARTALYGPGASVDPLVLDDLVVHDPVAGSTFLYPTPERILGEAPRYP